MVDGQNGHNGIIVLWNVVEEIKHEQEIALTRHQSLEEKIVV